MMKVKVYRSDGDIKQGLLREYTVRDSNELFVLFMNLILSNFNMLIEVEKSQSNINDDSGHDEYWFST
jgi:hypothetical protein